MSPSIVEVAGDVRPAEAELVGRGDDPAQRVGRTHHHASCARRRVRSRCRRRPTPRPAGRARAARQGDRRRSRAERLPPIRGGVTRIDRGGTGVPRAARRTPRQPVKFGSCTTGTAGATTSLRPRRCQCGSAVTRGCRRPRGGGRRGVSAARPRRRGPSASRGRGRSARRPTAASAATRRDARRGIDTVPPAPGTSPRPSSGRPRRASSVATTRAANAGSSMPGAEARAVQPDHEPSLQLVEPPRERAAESDDVRGRRGRGTTRTRRGRRPSRTTVRRRAR